MKNIFCFILFAVMFFSCEKDNNTNNNNLTNELIGTWKHTNTSTGFWFQFIFNSNLDGNRTDSDGDNDNFTYTFTATDVSFTSGLTGTHAYTIIDPNTLVFVGDTLVKQ